MTYTPMTPPLSPVQRSAQHPYRGPVLTHGDPLPTASDGRRSTNPRPNERSARSRPAYASMLADIAELQEALGPERSAAVAISVFA